jgi:tetratricopeptide (TPR) repeat protein
LEESLMIERELGNKWGISFALQLLALAIYFTQGDPAIIHALLQESLALARELEDRENIFHYLSLAGEVALSQGNFAVARTLAEELLAKAKEVRENVAVTEALFILAKLEARQGDLTTARALFEECFSFL